MCCIIQTACLVWFTVHAGSYLLCATSQSAYPKNYRHEDGGVYNGQWQGRNKQGLGSYQYPGGARYAGEWRNNYKEGRGVYTFPKVNCGSLIGSALLVCLLYFAYVICASSEGMSTQHCISVMASLFPAATQSPSCWCAWRSCCTMQ